MKDENIGIRQDGTHFPYLTDVEKACVNILQDRGQGRKTAISAEMLAHEIYGAGRDTIEQAKRDVRRLINHLIINHNIPIICMAGIGGGYWLPANKEEVEEFYTSFHKRAMTGLIKAARGKKAAFVDIMEQLTLWFDEPEGQKALEKVKLSLEADPVPVWVRLVTRYLARLQEDPEKYATEIRKIQQAYGDIFVPRETVRQLKVKTREFQDLLGRIEQMGG